MTVEDATADPRTGTRWGRSCVPLLLALASVAALGSMMWRDVFALQLSIQGEGMSFSSKEIYGQDLGFGVVPIDTATASNRPVLRAGIAKADINGLCVSKTERIAGVTMTLTLTAGDDNAGTREIKANNAVFDLSALGTPSGSTRVTDITLNGAAQIGIATPDITTVKDAAGNYVANPLWPVTNADGSSIEPAGNGQGWTGIDATSGILADVHGQLWDAQIRGNIVLPNLRIAVSPGTSSSCETRAKSGNFPQ